MKIPTLSSRTLLAVPLLALASLTACDATTDTHNPSTRTLSDSTAQICWTETNPDAVEGYEGLCADSAYLAQGPNFLHWGLPTGGEVVATTSTSTPSTTVKKAGAPTTSTTAKKSVPTTEKGATAERPTGNVVGQCNRIDLRGSDARNGWTTTVGWYDPDGTLNEC